MPRPSPSSTRSTDENQVQHRLNLYALAAGAAGVSMIALATPSEAEVIYTPAHATLGCEGTYGIDLNQDGVTDFTLQNACKVQHVGFYTFFSDLISVTPAHENKVVITSGFNFAAALSPGTKIGRNQRAQSKNALMARTYGYNNESQPYYYGPWPKGQQPLSGTGISNQWRNSLRLGPPLREVESSRTSAERRADRIRLRNRAQHSDSRRTDEGWTGCSLRGTQQRHG